jgi:Mrp family chromosome partitioning ATPase
LAGTVPAGAARVALVDFNFRNPHLDELLNTQPSPGIAEILLDGLAPEVAAQRVNPALDLYATGNAKGRILQILRNDGLRDLLGVLSQGYDHVILDAPAVNHFPDAQILAGVVDGVVLVAHTEQTSREAVAQGKKRLEAGGGKVVGLVLNLRTYPIPGFLYRRV